MTLDILVMMEERKNAKDKPNFDRINKEIQKKYRGERDLICRKCIDIEEIDRNKSI